MTWNLSESWKTTRLCRGMEGEDSILSHGRSNAGQSCRRYCGSGCHHHCLRRLWTKGSEI